MTTNNVTPINNRAAFLAGTSALDEEIRLPVKDVIELMAEYYRLKHPAAYVTKDGEKLSADEYEKRLEDLNTILKDWIAKWGEERKDGSRYLEAEGLPPLVVSQSSKKIVPVRDLHNEDPITFFRLVELDLLTGDCAGIERAHKRGAIAAPLDSIIKKIGGAVRLAFDERGRNQQ